MQLYRPHPAHLTLLKLEGPVIVRRRFRAWSVLSVQYAFWLG